MRLRLHKERETAEKCEAWCAAYQSCSFEITKKAVYIPKPVNGNPVDRF